MVNEITSSPILFMSSAQVERMRSPTISGCFTISSTVSWPMMPRRWPSITSRIRPSRSCGGLGQELLGGGQDRLRIRLHLDLRHGFHRDRHALLGVEILLRRDVERHQLQRQLAAVLHHREDHRALPDDAGAAEAVNDQRLVRAGLAVQPGHHHQEQDRQNSQTDNDPDFSRYSEGHNISSPYSKRTVSHERVYCFIISRSRSVRDGSSVPRKTSPSGVVI